MLRGSQIHVPLPLPLGNVKTILFTDVGVAKSPTRTVTTQTNHLSFSTLTYVKLEKLN